MTSAAVKMQNIVTNNAFAETGRIFNSVKAGEHLKLLNERYLDALQLSKEFGISTKKGMEYHKVAMDCIKAINVAVKTLDDMERRELSARILNGMKAK